jgi:hypothetical protein
VVFDDEHLGVSARPWVGMRRQRHMLASERRRIPACGLARSFLLAIHLNISEMN